jgi:cytochrome P450
MAIDLGQFDHNAPETRERSDALYAQLNAQCPVFHTERWGGFWGVARHDTLRRIGRAPEAFITGPGVMIPPMGHGRPLVPLETDGERHRAYRALLLPLLGPSVVARLEPEVSSVAGQILDEMLPRGEADLNEEYAKQIPAALITRLLGIEYDPAFWEAAETLVYGRLDSDGEQASLAAGDFLYAFFEKVVGQRLEGGADSGDLIDALVGAYVDGLVVSREDLIHLCFFMLIAGLENTAFAIRAALWHLAEHPPLRARLVDDPTLVRPTLEECLRMYAPITGLARTATERVELDGQAIETGDRLMLLFGAAGRDPGMFEEPNEFRIDRRGNPHLAFGVGAHRCIGSHLARLEMRIAVEELLARIPDYELADPAGTSWHPAGPLVVRWAGDLG